MLLVLALIAPVHAARPTSGGLFSFDPTDDVQTWDTDAVRVHYSAEGPNVVQAGDADADGVPDFVQDVGLTAADVLDRYADLGFRPPVSEAELGLGQLGGSAAFDFYLVDFGGSADGNFGVDACTSVPLHCAGYMVMENDFAGYAYPSDHDAIEVLTSHELFHAVQAAYDGELPGWISEGTAVWAERACNPSSNDFLRFASAYLTDTGRSLDRPPAGPVPTFAYATGLFWDFLAERHGAAVIVDLLAALERETVDPVDPLPALVAVLAARGDTLEEAWRDFADANLAVGKRAGLVPSHPYAATLRDVVAEAQGDSLDLEHRFYPLAATYFRIDHPGGELWFGVDEVAPDLWFALHPVQGGAADGRVEPAVATWFADAELAVSLGDLTDGGYWLVGTHAALADNSVRPRFCLGSAEVVVGCAPLPDDGDTGVEEPPDGCACSGTGGAASAWTLLGAALFLRRRKRS